jgi:hypothetical protein
MAMKIMAMPGINGGGVSMACITIVINNGNNTINEIMARGVMAINNGNIGESSSIISNGVAKSRISYQRK